MGMYGNVWDREFNHFSGMIPGSGFWAINLKISHAFCLLEGVWNMLRRPAGRPLHFRHNSGSAPKVDCCLEWTCVKCSWTWVLTQNLQEVAAIIFISNYNHQQINSWLSQCFFTLYHRVSLISQSITFTSHGDDSPASWKNVGKTSDFRICRGSVRQLQQPLQERPQRSSVCKADGQNSSAFIATTNSPYTKWCIDIYLKTQKSTKNTGYDKNHHKTRFFSTKTPEVLSTLDKPLVRRLGIPSRSGPVGHRHVVPHGLPQRYSLLGLKGLWRP